MRDRKKRNIIIGSLCCLLVFMAVGYALLSQTLNINGIANLTGKWKIYIDSITVKEIGGSAKSNQAEVTEDKLTANFDVELLKPGDYVEYDVVVKNEGTINAVLRELIPNIESNNMDILLTHSIIQGQILKAESETKFTLKIRFDERATEIVSGGKTSFDIQMVYEQYDGDAESIDPSLVPVTANDCFTVDENGVITGYDYSCGTYVTVPSVVNGTTVTEISGAAFTEGNLTIYMSADGESGFYVAKNQQAYNDLYILLGPDGEGMTEEMIAQMLFLEGDLNIPDTTGMTKQIMHIDLSNEYIGPGFANIEYLDLSQATSLKTIGAGAFVSNPSETILKYLNLDNKTIENIGTQSLHFSNLDSLTITTDMHSMFHNKMTATIDTLRIYPGTTTEIPDQSCEYVDYKITVNKLIIGEGITRIGKCTFKGNERDNEEYGAWNLSNVELPESLIEIGNSAFNRARITNVDLPSNLKTIGTYAFYNTELTSLTIPSAVETIGEGAFEIDSLTKLDFEKNSKLTYIGEVAFSGTKITSVVIPASVETIGDRAFYNTYSPALVNLAFEDNSQITYIGVEAFRGHKLSAIDFSPIKQKFEIDRLAFASSSDTITSVVIDDVILGREIFDGVTSLELIGDIEFSDDFSSEVTYVEPVMFNLTKLIIKSDTLEEIVPFAFNFDSTQTTTLEFLNSSGTELNSSIKTIGKNAFESAIPIILKLPTSLETIGHSAFGRANPTIFVMSPVIKNIGDASFGQLEIEALTIPSTIESIGAYAFQSLPATSTLTINKAEGSFTTDWAWSGSAKVIYNP